MLGSLNDFIESQQPTLQPLHFYLLQEDEQITPIVRQSRRADSRKRRSRVSMSEYIPSDKKYLFPGTNKNLHKKSKSIALDQSAPNYLTGRKPISESRISSMFHGTNTRKNPLDLSEQSRGLKREHNLLRAVARTKISETQKIKVSEYEQSFERMTAGLGKIQLRPVVGQPPRDEVNQQYQTFRSLTIKQEKRAKSQINHRKRIQFENCLNWSKKHRKNGSFYAGQLGKNPPQVDANASLKRRKEILQNIHQRSSSVSFVEHV